ncbi:MAG: protein kinase [Calothrix sp. MO_192.B10]|nr:protein kinase [Calothrix sp. MO_192.B10]
MIGQLLAGHYKVLKVLGEGGFGQTYIVEDIHLPGKPKCVLKHLKPTSTDPQVLEAARRLFRKEAETLQKLGNHDQIPRLLAYLEENQEFYLVQEFIYGHTLSKELPPGKKWTESQIIQMLIEVLKILEFVHSQGVIHRDIKPDNLIRNALDHKLFLIDFGAIKQIRSQAAMASRGASQRVLPLGNRKGMLPGGGAQGAMIASSNNHITIAVGTPGYMPSEHIRRVPRPSSDIYALGMTAIQALTGIHPHKLQDDPHTGEILWQHLAFVSSELAGILTKMTRYHFKDRYQTATEALQALEELVQTSEVGLPILQQSLETTSLHELTLEWVQDEEIKMRKILEHQHSKNPGRIRIGRDPGQCDIVLLDPTISGLHVEIFFHPQKQKFYLRNLRQKNPPILDGQLLLAGEMPLTTGSSLRLGQQVFTVSDITCRDYPAGYTPMEYMTDCEMVPQEPMLKTMRWQKPVKQAKPVQELAPKSIPVVPPTIAPTVSLNNKLFLMIGVGIAGFITTIAGLLLFKTENIVATKPGQNFISPQSQLCREVTPTRGRESAELHVNPQRNSNRFAQLSKGDIVLFMQVEGDFIKVKLNNGTQGWVVWDQIRPCRV